MAEADSRRETIKALRGQIDRLQAAGGRSFSAGDVRRTLRRQRTAGAAMPAARTRPAVAAADTRVQRRDIPFLPPGRNPGATVPAPSDESTVRLEDAAPGVVIEVPTLGRFYERVVRVGGLEDGSVVDHAFRRAVDDPASALYVRVGAAVTAGALRLEDALFVDIETTGLSSSPLFLIGAMVWRDGGLQVRQLLARDYAEERAVLGAFAALAGESPLLVSFNGKSFDLPYIRARAAVGRVRVPNAIGHVDLLHAARRAWKTRLPNCRLQTLEQEIFQRHRGGDIPGSEIPDVYHAFVRDGNARRMAVVLEHNLRDLVTLAELLGHLPVSA